MRSARRLSILFLLLLLLTAVNAVVVRADDDEAETYDEKARVARISMIEGPVNLKRSGNTDWERARINFALIEGDTLGTEAGARLELQIDARNFVRLSENSVV